MKGWRGNRTIVIGTRNTYGSTTCKHWVGVRRTRDRRILCSCTTWDYTLRQWYLVPLVQKFPKDSILGMSIIVARSSFSLACFVSLPTTPILMWCSDIRHLDIQADRQTVRQIRQTDTKMNQLLINATKS